MKPTGRSLGASTSLGQGITVWDSRPVSPRSYQWNFDLQQQLKWDVLLDAAYVGNRGVHLAGNHQFDNLPSQFLSQGSTLLTQVPNPFYGNIPTGALLQPTVTMETLLVPFPQFTSVDVINDTSGDSSYHSFQFKAEKRMSRGFSFLVAYTFSKLIADVPWAVSTIGGNNGSGTFQNLYDLHAERALSSQNPPQSLALSYHYQLLFGKGKGPATWLFGNLGAQRAPAGVVDVGEQ